MANLQKYAVHADYAKMPSVPFPFNGILTRILNAWVLLDVQIRQGAIMRNAHKHWVPSADRSYFPVYEFRPVAARADEILPAVIYYHGGAFVLTYASTHVANMQQYADRAHCAVFMVDYRLAPQHVFPKGFEDCYAALLWAQEKADWLHIDAKRLAVMGDSAGGCFAAGIAQKACDEKSVALRGQGLIYPALDNHCSSKSATQFDDAPVFNGVANKRMWEVYTPGHFGKSAPAYAAPANRELLEGLAPAYVETAEFDPLRDEGRDYAQRLQNAGVDVNQHHPAGTVHGFDMMKHNALTESALQNRCAFLKSIFS